MKQTLPLVALLVATPALSEYSRQLHTHEHGVGALDIAIEDNTVTLEFHAPGADIVGFEYTAKTEEDRDAIDKAVATLARPLDLFVLPTAAGCSVTQASAELVSELDPDDHDHDDHAHDDHDDHADEASHTEFHAEYALTCADPTAIDEIAFAYFDTFENARELDIQIVTASGAQAFEVTRDAPTLDLRNLF